MKWAEIAFSGSFFITPSHRIIMFLWWLAKSWGHVIIIFIRLVIQ